MRLKLPPNLNESMTNDLVFRSLSHLLLECAKPSG